MGLGRVSRPEQSRRRSPRNLLRQNFSEILQIIRSCRRVPSPAISPWLSFWESIVRATLLAISATSLACYAAPASAQQDHHGNELQRYMQRTSSEISTPSVDGFWRVHQIDGRGSAHLRITDVYGRTQLILGLVDGRIWAVPGCDTETSVSLPDASLPIPDDAMISIVHLGEQFQVLHFGHPSGSIWSVEPLQTSR